MRRRKPPDIAKLRTRLEQSSRILLIRLRSLGDSILTLPLLNALHCWNPALQIDVLIEDQFAPVFQRHPAVHDVLAMRTRNSPASRGWSKGRTVFEIWKRHYGAVLNLHGGSTSTLFTIASGARLRIGQEIHRRSWVYNCRIPPSSEVWNREGVHTVEHQLSLLRWLSLPLPAKLIADLRLSGSAVSRVHRRLRDANILPGRYFLIHPTATLDTKRWPAQNFARVADWLVNQEGLPVIFTSGPNEEQILLDVGRNTDKCYRYWSDLELDDLFVLVKDSRLFIGNDSGPTHVAAALHKPLVVIWGSSDYRAWHPWDADFEVVRSDLPCMPCPGYTCEAFGRPKCIQDISVEGVTAACERLLARLGPSGSGESGPES